MDDYIQKEKYVNSSPEPISIEKTKKILEQMDKCVCRIYNNNCEGTGFFTKIPYKSGFLPVLITNNHILDKNDIKNNDKITIYLNYDKKVSIIEINNERKRYTDIELDITIIEIYEKDHINNEFLYLDESIIDYFESNKQVNPEYLKNIYSNKSIYLLNYPEGNNIVVSYGPPPKFINKEIQHNCITKNGSSGSPILLINNQKLIGIHYGSSEKFNFNKGVSIIYAIIEFQKKHF